MQLFAQIEMVSNDDGSRRPVWHVSEDGYSRPSFCGAVSVRAADDFEQGEALRALLGDPETAEEWCGDCVARVGRSFLWARSE